MTLSKNLKTKPTRLLNSQLRGMVCHAPTYRMKGNTMLNYKATPKPKPSTAAILYGAVEFAKQRATMMAELVHPAKREQGKSFCQREIVRRNKAQYGKRQIAIHISEHYIAIQRDYHMRLADTEIKVFESKPIAYLESYRAALLNSGYRLLDANPHMLIFQYEGRH
jgi:hypothetical protein